MKRSWLLAALALLVAAQPSGASTFLAMSTDELVRDSTAIVEGEVLKVESYWESTARIIVTEALVQVEDLVVGQAPTVVRVKTFGGTVNGFTVDAIGFPTFARGERVLLFLSPDTEADTLRVTGYQQGQYRIVRDAQNREIAVSAVEGSHLVFPNGRALDRPERMPLAELKERIAEAARAGR